MTENNRLIISGETRDNNTCQLRFEGWCPMLVSETEVLEAQDSSKVGGICRKWKLTATRRGFGQRISCKLGRQLRRDQECGGYTISEQPNLPKPPPQNPPKRSA